jgi:hypothetical protein
MTIQQEEPRDGTDNSMETRLKVFDQRKQVVADVLLWNKRAVFDALAGITEVIVRFDGYGDSGQIDSTLARIGRAEVTLPESVIIMREESEEDDGRAVMIVEKTLQDAIEMLCYAYLEENHEGWEINDGSSGTFVFNVGTRTIELEHTRRETFTDYEEF